VIYRAAILGAAGASFSPDDIAGLQLWLDASDETTITESSGSVSQWDDKSGNANHVSNGTASGQPTTGTRTINSLNVLDFDGGDVLEATFSLSQPYTSFVVTENDATGANAYVLTSSSPISGISWISSKWQLFAGSLLAGAVDAGPAITAGVFNGASSEIRVSGTTNSGNAGTNDMGNLMVGARGVADLNYDGGIAEALIYSGALSATDIEALELHLAAKWGITLS